MKRSGVLSLVTVAVLVGITVLATTRCRAIRVAPAERLETWTDEPYDALLDACVREGLVDYERLRRDFAHDLARSALRDLALGSRNETGNRDRDPDGHDGADDEAGRERGLAHHIPPNGPNRPGT